MTLAGPRLSPAFLDSLEGIGWDGDLDEMLAARTGTVVVHRDRDVDVLAQSLPDLRVRSL